MVCLREWLEAYVAAFESHRPDSHFGAHLFVNASCMLQRRPLLGERQFGEWLSAGGYREFGSPEKLCAVNLRVNQNALAGVLSSGTHGNFPPAKDEMSVGAGLAPPWQACCKKHKTRPEQAPFELIFGIHLCKPFLERLS